MSFSIIACESPLVEGGECLDQETGSRRTSKREKLGKGFVLFICLWLFASTMAWAGTFCTSSSCVTSENFDTGFTSGGGTGTGTGFGTTGSDWVNATGDNGEWYVMAGQTPTAGGGGGSQRDVGPATDHTTGLGNYLYVEASGNSYPTGAHVDLLSPTFSIPSGSAYATFFVFSNNQTPGNPDHHLHVDILNSSGTVLHSDRVVIGDTEIAHWRPAYVDLSDVSGTVRLRLRWTRDSGNNSRQDIAIDDFAVVSTGSSTPGTGQLVDQTYVLPAPENDILSFLQTVRGFNTGIPQAEDPVETYTAIAVAHDGTIIYYDEWEDGYEADITNPTQTFGDATAGPAPITTSTQIWGDGDPANGYPPGYPADELNTGDVIVLREPEIVSTTLGSILDFDAEDVIASTQEIAITRAFWASGSETLNAGSIELFPTSRWGSSYQIPFGEDINAHLTNSNGGTSCGDNDPFQSTALLVMADTDNTSVDVDTNGDGTTDTSFTLNRGESQFVDNIDVGATVTATGGNVQVDAFTADLNSNYGSRFYTLLPSDQFTDNYYAPFDSSGDGSGELIIYNPNFSDVDVNIYSGANPGTPVNPPSPLTVPAGSYATYVLPAGSLAGGSDATRVQSTGGEPIYVVAVMDACDDAHDWGGALLPDNNLTSAILIPLGFGHDPTLTVTGFQDYSPVWVTPTADTYIYVDFNGDFIPDKVDLNGDGDTNDTVDGIDENTSNQGMFVNELQLLRIHDPSDGDQSGTLMFSLTTPGYGVNGNTTGFVSGATLAGGWGQDQDSSIPTGAPSIDVGTAFAPITFPQNLPVTLDRFRATRMGRGIRFDWGTASEAFTVGFNLWAQIDGGWRQLNRNLLVNRVTDSTAPQRYRVSVHAPRRNVDAVGISSVDTDGSQHFYGPFELNKTYGSQSTPEPIPWHDIRAQLDQNMRLRGYEKSGHRYHRRHGGARRLADFRNHFPEINLATAHEGIDRVTYEELRAAGIDLEGVPVGELAITHKGQPVPRYVYDGRGRGFGRGGYIDFYAAPVDEEDARYTSTNMYQLQVDGRLALPSGEVNRDPNPTAAPAYYIEKVKRDVNVEYGLNMPSSNPWYENRLLGIPGSRVDRANVTLALDHLAQGVNDPDVKLHLGLDGITKFAGSTPDHNVQIYLNGGQDPVADLTNDGIVNWQIDVPVTASALQDGDNSIRVAVPGVDGYPFDLIYGDTYEIDYPRQFVAVDNALDFSGQADSFHVTGFNRRDVVAYAVAGRNLARINVQTNRVQGKVIADFPGVAIGKATYWVSTEDSLPSPEVSVVDRSRDLVDPTADYIIIAHPSFMDTMENAQDFLSAKRAQGYSPHIVDVYDVINQYGYGLPVPEGIRAYLQAQDSANPIKQVLLVGGATSDPMNYTGAGSVDFIPTFFAGTSDIIRHSPSDGLLVDLYGPDGHTGDPDGVPDRSVGRWPVRTAEELKTIIDKTLKYQETMASRRSAMLVADQTDARFPPFSSQVEKVGAKLMSPGTPPQPWTDVTRVFMDDFSSPGDARNALKQGFEHGQTITLYSGHGSPSGWSFQGLLDWQTAKSLTNAGLPTLVGTMSCYTTYFVAPSTDTIGHQLLLSGDRGAALIQGAATLSGFSQNEELLGRVTDAMVGGQSVGEAVLTARKALGKSYSDVITNWSVLGDPSLRIEP